MAISRLLLQTLGDLLPPLIQRGPQQGNDIFARIAAMLRHQQSNISAKLRTVNNAALGGNVSNHMAAKSFILSTCCYQFAILFAQCDFIDFRSAQLGQWFAGRPETCRNFERSQLSL